jgi:nucleotide-binding universal stress UspA family protein
MYKRILVPLDGSRGAETILPYVEEFAASCRGTVILFHVVESKAIAARLTVCMEGIVVSPALETLDKAMVRANRDAEAYLRAVMASLRCPSLHQEAAVVVEGSVIDQVLRAVLHQDVNLIALTSRGRGGPSRWFSRNVVAGILRQVDCPVLLVHPKVPSGLQKRQKSHLFEV